MSSVSFDTMKTASGIPEQAVVVDNTGNDVLNLSNDDDESQNTISLDWHTSL